MSSKKRTSLRVNLVCYEDRGGGLSRDLDVLLEAFGGHGSAPISTHDGLPPVDVFFNGWRRRRPAAGLQKLLGGVGTRTRKARNRITGRPWFHMNLFLESITPDFLPMGRVNALLPNPEWFLERDLPHLPSMDLVLCKTHDAEKIFQERGCPTRYLGFTSLDRAAPEGLAAVKPTFLHVAGASEYKGTEPLVEAWRRHPEWPTLTLVQSPRLLYADETIEPLDPPANVRYLRKRLDEEDLLALQQQAAFHLYPSETEGFGQILMEAMSAWSVVLATDAPPMNEVIRPDWGILVKPARSHDLNLGMRHFVDPSGLEEAVGSLLELPRESWKGMARRGREQFEGERDRFQNRVGELLGALHRTSTPG